MAQQASNWRGVGRMAGWVTVVTLGGPAVTHAQFDQGAAAADPSMMQSSAAPSAASAAPRPAAAAGGGFASPDGFMGLKPGRGQVIPFEQAMGLVLKNSFDLKIAYEKLFQAELFIRKAWSTVLPRLSATAGYTFNWPQISFQAVSQEQLDAQAAAARGQLEGQAQIYDAQAAAAAADGNYNTEFANRALATRLRAQAGGISAGSAPEPVAINPTNVLNGGLNFSLVLFNGRAIPLLYNAYDSVTQTKATIDRSRTTALYMAALGYFNAVSAKRLVSIAEMQVRNLEAHLKVTRVRVEVGTLPRLAARRAESDLERAKASVRTARNAYRSALGGLGMTLGVDEEFEVAELPPVPMFEETMGEEELIAHAEGHRPDFTAAKLAVAIAERNRIDALMRWMPTVSLTAAARATSNVRGFQKDPITYAVMLNASLPLYDGGERYTAWRESGSQIREAKLSLDQARWRLGSSVRGNLREVSVRKENLGNQRLAKQLAEEAAQDARARFEVGAATELEVLDAEQLVVSAALDLTMAELELQTSRLALSYVVGAFNPAIQTGDKPLPEGVSPVDFSGVAMPGMASTTVVIHEDPSAPQRVPVLVPAGRAGRSGHAVGQGLSFSPSAAELLKAGLVGSPEEGLP